MRRLFLLAAAGVGAAALYRQSHKKAAFKQEEQVLDSTIDDSFPASDPPSYSVPITIGGARN